MREIHDSISGGYRFLRRLEARLEFTFIRFLAERVSFLAYFIQNPQNGQSRRVESWSSVTSFSITV